MSLKKSKNIGAMILGPILTLSTIFIASYIVQYLVVSKDFNGVEMNSLEEKQKVATIVINDKVDDIVGAISDLNRGKVAFYDAVHSGDPDAIHEQMTAAALRNKCASFIFTDMDGNVLANNFDYNETELKTVIEYVRKQGTISGTHDLPLNHLALMSAGVVHDSEKTPLGIAIFVGFNSFDMKALGEMYKRVGTELIVFSNDQCRACTDSAITDLSKVKPDPEMYNTCAVNHTPWLGKSANILKEYGQSGYFCAFPLMSFDGSFKGIMALREDTSGLDTVLDRLKLGSLVTIIAIIIIALLINRAIKGQLIKPAEQLAKDVSVIAKGDLTKRIAIDKSCKEIAELTNNIVSMQEKIKAVITPVNETANVIAEAMTKLTTEADNLSNASSRQASTLEEISSAMEEMGANIQQNTDNSVNTNKLAQDINGLVDAMSSASSNSFEAVKKIADNISAINDLVSQTNILALNASVEAARAGESGKGFAVVAKEVGRLAEQTHLTADEINDTADSSISESEIANRHVQDLLPRIEKVVNLVKEITTASIEQNTGVSHVNVAIADLNKVTQENASGAELIASSAKDIQHRMDDLNKAIHIFKV